MSTPLWWMRWQLATLHMEAAMFVALWALCAQAHPGMALLPAGHLEKGGASMGGAVSGGVGLDQSKSGALSARLFSGMSAIASGQPVKAPATEAAMDTLLVEWEYFRPQEAHPSRRSAHEEAWDDEDAPVDVQ